MEYVLLAIWPKCGEGRKGSNAPAAFWFRWSWAIVQDDSCSKTVSTLPTFCQRWFWHQPIQSPHLFYTLFDRTKLFSPLLVSCMVVHLKVDLFTSFWTAVFLKVLTYLLQCYLRSCNIVSHRYLTSASQYANFIHTN